jgi:hypothetical protein
MAGQPQGAFQLTAITVEDASLLNPPNIIGRGDNFSIAVSFSGIPTHPVYGGTWAAIRNLAQPYEVKVYIESLGEGYEGVLATGNGNLVAGQDAYTFNLNVVAGVPSGPPAPVPGQLSDGLYKVGATVRIPSFPQWVGYIEDTFVQISTGAA